MAAVAAAAVLGLLEPHMTGPGGDMFALFYDAKSKTVQGINGSGRSPKGLSYDEVVRDVAEFNKQTNAKKNKKGTIPGIPSALVHSVTVPGAVAGWIDTVETFGNGKLTLAEILEPAIRLAENGTPIPEITAELWEAGAKTGLLASEFLVEDKKQTTTTTTTLRAPKPGELFVNNAYAETLKRIAENGKDGFYKGKTADAIVDTIRSLGGKLSHEDLQAHESTILEAGETASTHFVPSTFTCSTSKNKGKQLRIHEIPPSGQGIVALQALAILRVLQKEKYIDSLEKYEHNSAEYLHILIEALKSAFRDVGSHTVADLSVEANKNIDIKKVLTDEYVSDILKSADNTNIQFDSKKASKNTNISLGSASDTVYMTATDQWGNACSLINSVYGLFGSKIAPKGLGFVLQNRGANFNLVKESPNVYEPGKRPYHTIIPAMVTREPENTEYGENDDYSGDLYCTYGVMGGFMQPQGHVQVLLNMTVFGLNEQEALDAPRICLIPGTPSENEESNIGGTPGGPTTTPETVAAIEEGIPEETIKGLEALGHKVTVVKGGERSLFGRGQVIRWNAYTEDDDGLIYSAGSDCRGDGAAIPQVF